MVITLTERAVLTLPHHFAELRKTIEPPRNRRDAAASIPGDVRDFLKDATDFSTQSPHSRLTGSYARSTAIHSIKDVDFVVFIRVEDGEDPDTEEVLGNLYTKLKDLPDAIDRPGSTQILRKQRRSIRVEFEEEDFFLDVVPAWLKNGLDEPLWVPDREWSKWVKSDPLGYGDALSSLNADSGEKVVPLIKLFKHWRTIQMQRRRPKSYWMESLVYRHLNNDWVTTAGKSYAELFLDLIRSIRDHFQPVLDGHGVPAIPDPMLGNNVAATWERLAFESFMARLDESIGWAERAVGKTNDEIDEAVNLWQKVFGVEYFIDSADVRRLQMADWLGRGSVFVTASGRVSGIRPLSEPSVESRSHRFYGDAS